MQFEEQRLILKPMPAVEVQSSQVRLRDTQGDLRAALLAGETDGLVQQKRTDPAVAFGRLCDQLVHEAGVGGMVQARAEGVAEQAEHYRGRMASKAWHPGR